MHTDQRFSHDRMAFRQGQRADSSLWSESSSRGIVATAHYLATAAGVEMLERGGNAVDAAVAASLALGVCEPSGSGLGGMAMMVIRLADSGRTFVLPGPCQAPRRATPEAVAESTNRYRGHSAVAVPAYLKVLEKAASDYGTFQPATLLAPAIRIAEEGYPLTAFQQSVIRQNRRPLRKRCRFGLNEKSEPLSLGSCIRQPALAKTLRRLAEAGFEDFYEGETARLICDDMRRNGGFIREDDLRELPSPVDTEPLSGTFGELQVLTAGPPGGGISLLQMLQIFDQCEEADFHPDSGEGAIRLAEIIRRSRGDRRRLRLGVRADAVGEAAEVLTLKYARSVAGELQAAALESSGETSHISVIDQSGNTVSLTQSIERSLGAAVSAPELGFLYNGYLRAFKVRNRHHPNFLRPGALARSNAAPTILLNRNGTPWGAIGSTGAERTASGMLQVLVRLRSQSPFEAVFAPRLHCTPERVIYLEAERFPPASLRALSKGGFDLQDMGAFSFQAGGMTLVFRQGKEFCGVADPRRDGAAGGAREKADPQQQ